MTDDSTTSARREDGKSPFAGFETVEELRYDFVEQRLEGLVAVVESQGEQIAILCALLAQLEE